MEIAVTFQEHHPPVGRLRVVDPARRAATGDPADWVAFAGWMELLRALDRVLAEWPVAGGQS